MELSKVGQALAGVVVAAFFLIMVILVAFTATRQPPAVQGSLKNTLETIEEDAGLSGTAIAPIDVYGKKWIAAAVVCPGTTAEQLSRQFQVDPQAIGFTGDVVPESDNYMLVRDQEGGAHAEKLKRREIDLCVQPMGGYFDSRSMLPLIQDQGGQWILAG